MLNCSLLCSLHSEMYFKCPQDFTVGKRNLIESRKAWTTLILKINVSLIYQKNVPHIGCWTNGQSIGQGRKWRPLNHFMSLLTVILPFPYHVSGVVTIFAAFSHSQTVAYFICSETCCRWGRKQSKTKSLPQVKLWGIQFYQQKSGIHKH